MHDQSLPASRADETGDRLFGLTRWSLVAGAAAVDETMQERALTALFEQYRRPITLYIRRRLSHHHDCEDVLQETFQQLIARKPFGNLAPERGRFRDYLKRCAANVIAGRIRAATAARRTAPEAGSPDLGEDCVEDDETQFDAEWARTMVGSVITALKAECAGRGRTDFFDAVKGWIITEPAEGGYAEAAARLNTSQEGLRQFVKRMRQRFQELMREQVAATVDDGEVQDELRHLMRAFTRGRTGE